MTSGVMSRRAASSRTAAAATGSRGTWRQPVGLPGKTCAASYPASRARTSARASPVLMPTWRPRRLSIPNQQPLQHERLGEDGQVATATCRHDHDVPDAYTAQAGDVQAGLDGDD